MFLMDQVDTMASSWGRISLKEPHLRELCAWVRRSHQREAIGDIPEDGADTGWAAVLCQDIQWEFQRPH